MHAHMKWFDGSIMVVVNGNACCLQLRCKIIYSVICLVLVTSKQAGLYLVIWQSFFMLSARGAHPFIHRTKKEHKDSVDL